MDPTAWMRIGWRPAGSGAGIFVPTTAGLVNLMLLGALAKGIWPLIANPRDMGARHRGSRIKV
jgi:hypothetical protein